MRNITGKRIRLARRSKNLTQDELAIKLQIRGFKHTRNTIAKIEGGIRQVNDIEIKAISDALAIPIVWFFEEEA